MKKHTLGRRVTHTNAKGTNIAKTLLASTPLQHNSNIQYQPSTHMNMQLSQKKEVGVDTERILQKKDEISAKAVEMKIKRRKGEEKGESRERNEN